MGRLLITLFLREKKRFPLLHSISRTSSKRTVWNTMTA
jgi:hypothetical protein